MSDQPEGLCPVSFLDNLDVCDLENYKHPPFMWILWYLSLIGKAAYDKVMELLNEEGDGDGGDKKDKKEDKGKESEEPAEEEEEEAAEEEAPPEEEAAAEDAPAEEEG